MPDLLLGGSAVTVEAGAGSGQSGQYAQPVKAEGVPPSCQLIPSTECCSVPVAMAAKDWKVTPRRIRFLLNEGRLEGHRGLNAYWLVCLILPLPLHIRGKGHGFKTISGTGTVEGMRHLDSHAGERQFMNRVKIGMISCAKKISASLCNPHV